MGETGPEPGAVAAEGEAGDEAGGEARVEPGVLADG